MCEGCGGALELQALAFNMVFELETTGLQPHSLLQSTASYNLAAFMKLFKNPGPELMRKFDGNDQKLSI